MFLEMNTLQLGPYWQEVQVPMHIRGEITLLRELGGTGIQRTCVYVCRWGRCLECVYMFVCVCILSSNILVTRVTGSGSDSPNKVDPVTHPQ